MAGDSIQKDGRGPDRQGSEVRNGDDWPGERCRSCLAPVIWLPTRAGGHMIIDAETVTAGDLAFDPQKHRSHFASCPDAAQWRRKKKGP